MIEAEHLTRRYRDLLAVDDLSFTVEPGEILGFLGPNGAGKTSTLRMITGALPPSDGRARVAGFDVFESPFEVRRRVGYLPETPPLYVDLLVREQLAFAAALRGIPRRARRAAIDTAAQRAGVTDVLPRRVGNLSKGYRQRVGLAQALVGAPPVLLLDEPTAGMDPTQVREVRGLIKALKGDHTVLLSTHLLGEVAAVCDRVLILRAGRRVALDSLDALTAGREGSLEEIFVELTG